MPLYYTEYYGNPPELEEDLEPEEEDDEYDPGEALDSPRPIDWTEAA